MLLLSLLTETEKNWLSVADESAKILTSEKWRDTHPTANDWLANMAAQVGLSINTLKRQIRVADFIQKEVGAVRWAKLLSNPPSFASLELVQRLFQNDRQASDTDIFEKVLAGQLTFRGVRALLNERSSASTASGRRLVAMRSKQFELTASAQLKEHCSVFFGGILTPNMKIDFEEFRRDLPLGYLRPDVLSVGRWKQTNEISFVSAFEIQFLNSEDRRQAVARTLQKAALMEKFFNQVWFIYPVSDLASEHIEEFYRELAIRLIELEMSSVGLVHMPEAKDGSDGDSAPIFRKIAQFNARPKSQMALIPYL